MSATALKWSASQPRHTCETVNCSAAMAGLHVSAACACYGRAAQNATKNCDPNGVEWFSTAAGMLLWALTHPTHSGIPRFNHVRQAVRWHLAIMRHRASASVNPAPLCGLSFAPTAPATSHPLDGPTCCHPPRPAALDQQGTCSVRQSDRQARPQC